MKTKYIILTLIFGILAITNCVDAQKNNETMKITKIKYRFGDSSVPPPYHRSYSVVLTKDSLHIVVDSYGDIISDTIFTIDSLQFDTIVANIDKFKINKCKLQKNEGCTGGTSKSLYLYENDKEILSGYKYYCGGEIYGDMCGDLKLFATEIKKLIPDLKALLKK